MSKLTMAVAIGSIIEKMARPRRRRGVDERIKPFKAKELLEVFAVEEDEPFFRAVIQLIRRRGIQLAERAGTEGLSSDRSKGLAMSAVAVEDVADELLEWAERSRAARSGGAQEDLEVE